MLGCLSMGLLGFLRNEQTTQLCQLMKSLDSSQDYIMLVHQVLARGQGWGRGMPSACEIGKGDAGG